MASNSKNTASALEIDRLAIQLAKDPHSKVFLPLAEEYCKVGMWEEAVSVLEEGLKHYPGFITAMVALGRAYDQLNQPTKARAVLEGAVKLSPDNLRAHRTLIKIYVTQGLRDEALTSCRIILAMNPRDEEALSVQASLGVDQPAEREKPTTAASTKQKTAALVPEETRASQLLPKAAAEEGRIAASPLNVATSIMEHALHKSDHPAKTESSEVDGQNSPEESSPHAKTIAQLEGWLRSIERERRDRTASGDASS